jgi:hypothetical protein
MGVVKAAQALVVGLASVIGAFLDFSSVAAAEQPGANNWYATLSLEPPDPTPLPDPAPPEGGGTWQVMAREWISAMSKLEAHNNSVSTTQMYLYGGSIAYVPAGESGLAFLLTGYYGVSFGYSNFQDLFSEGSSNLRRVDIEALAKIPIASTPAYTAMGIRFIDFKRDDTATAHGYYVGPNSTLQQFTVPYTRLTDYKYYLGEIGVGSVTQLDENGKHRMFGGVMFAAGAYNTAQDYSYYGNVAAYGLDLAGSSKFTPVIGMDTHFGYAYSPWPSVTFSLRYRAFVMADIYDGLRISSRGIVWPIDYSHYSLVHGPEFNLAYQF